MNKAVTSLLFLALVAIVCEADVTVDEDIEAVVITAPKRQSRQLVFQYQRLGGLFPRVPLYTSCTTAEGQPGRCMTVNECYPKRKIFRLAPHETWAMGLYNTCKVQSKRGVQIFGTCCPLASAESPASVGDQEVVKEKKKKKKKPSKRKTSCLLSSIQKSQVRQTRCTRDNSNLKSSAMDFMKIVGGSPTEPHQFKFVAALLTEDYPGGHKRQFCGGSLIDRHHILTAAHCVASYREDDVERLIVHLGAHHLTDTNGMSIHHVDRIVRHIDFSTKTLDNDVAILTLRDPAPINFFNVKQICLPTGQSSYVGRRAIVAGWGSLASAGSQPSNLHMVEVEVWDNNRCSSSYGSDAPGGITARMMCASLPGKDSCQGDSGGALFTCNNGYNNCAQIGVVSWGISCADSRYPGVYTRITEMNDWIRRITDCY